MNILKELIVMSEATDMTELPYDVYHELEQQVHNGAKDLDKKYVNALELVKEAYKVEHVELPDPSMKKAWEQFSTLLQYATEKLTKFRGIDGDWRMSSHVFRESTEFSNYRVTIDDGDSCKSYTVRDENIDSLVESMKSSLVKEYEIDVSKDGENSAELNFSKWKIKQTKKIKIKKI